MNVRFRHTLPLGVFAIAAALWAPAALWAQEGVAASAEALASVRPMTTLRAAEPGYFDGYLIDNARQALAGQRYDQAADFVNRALEDQPRNPEYLLLSAEIAEKLGQWAEAERRLSQALLLTPHDEASLARRGVARWQLGQTERAAADLRRALADASPEAPWRGSAEQALEDIAAGRAAPIPTLNEEADRARLEEDWSLVLIMEERGNWDWLERFYTRLMRYSPETVSYAHVPRGYARLSLGRPQEAAEDFAAALAQPGLDSQARAELEATLEAVLARLEAEEREQAALVQIAALGAVSQLAPSLNRQSLSSQSLNRQSLDRAAPPPAEPEQAVPEPTEPAPAVTPPPVPTKPKAVRYNVWPDFQAMGELLAAGQPEALEGYVARLRPLKLTGEEQGQLDYYYGEWLRAQGRREEARQYFQAAEALVTEPYRRSDLLWRLAEDSRQEPERAAEYARQSAAILPQAHWRQSAVGSLMAGFGRDQEAVDYFQRSLALQEPSRAEVGIYQDVAKAYQRLGDDEAHRDYLRRYIDRATALYAGQLDLTRTEVEDLYDARRLHSYLDRHWGLDSYIFATSYDNGDYSVQSVNELYANFRPGGLMLQPYAQLNGSLSSRYSGSYFEPWLGREQQWSGRSNLGDSAHGAIGIRLYPFPESRHSLSVGLEQLFALGDQSENDSRLRLNHFWHSGLDWEPFAKAWPYAIVMNQAAYSTRNNDLTAFGEVRGGRSFKLGALNEHLVLSPHLSAVWGYGGEDVDRGQRWSLEAGPGLSLRKWYREDTYNAPGASADLTMQYRWGLSHDRHNVFSVTFSHSF